MKLFSILLLLSAGVCMAHQSAQDCPTNSFHSGKCLPWCKEGQVSESCAQRDIHKAKCPDGKGVSCLGNICACVDDPAPLKCGKYEHVEFDEEADVIAIPENRHPYHKVPGSDRCVPDLHTVTEKEWQEIMRRLKKLESK